ncbi:G-type lectin S-receptor-like serine/threonine-protein kinase SD1-1 [Asparagus officinalis]|uniref:G-type lectin S-receptor-like serine/threonine-protein kinase SD1-1 n=1 Tax=Asparagus officinalis TaxID=4686 RepID=UPI00098E86E8|nr:G-type lectin S-receptor-like serine/threonine-protein kinase SD1-1 [Asparagus officinalis]
MKPLFLFLISFLLRLLISSHAQIQPSYEVNNPQYNCASTINGSTTQGYACDGAQRGCDTYLTFRSQTKYQTPSQISSLLNVNPSSILNNIPENSSLIPIDELVIIPTTCSCTGNYSQHNATYTIQTTGETYFSIANGTYQGLSTCQAIMAQNPYNPLELVHGMKINVPLRCACPTTDQITEFGVKYLLTYFVTWGDGVRSIARKFNSSYQSVLDANGLSSGDVIYPFTTLLIPIDAEPTKVQVQSLQPPPLSPEPPVSRGSRKKWIYVGVASGAVFLVSTSILSLYFCCFRNGENPIFKQGVRRFFFKNQSNNGDMENDIDLPLFDFDTIAVATDNFSQGNKLGEGGFGPVYKGKLGEDEEIAVKRLSRASQQGVDEFKNEIVLIAKLQHRNLVRLLGGCIQGEERMLIYEFMPNSSLDTFLFGKVEGTYLDWQTRYQIIIGITRGLVYLHHDSRFRIIHRDLKASNILLDKNMNPKISDFGMARIFIGDETDFNTRKVVGTYGYMSPEYALEGIFSLKSDVFSFGVLILEIISGKRNRGVYAFSSHLNLVAHVWSLWNEDQSLQLVDELIIHSFTMNEVLKCIKIGLLCVQENPDDRPLMWSVIQMLGSDIASLPQPKQPGFVSRIGPVEINQSASKNKSCTSNSMSLTMLEGR